MKHINALMSPKVYSNLQTLLAEARERAEDSILTCSLTTDEIEDIQIALN